MTGPEQVFEGAEIVLSEKRNVILSEIFEFYFSQIFETEILSCPAPLGGLAPPGCTQTKSDNKINF